MKNLLLFSTLFASLFFIVNCSKNSSSTAGATATATANGVCPSGYSFVNGQCLNGNGQSGGAQDFALGFWADNHTGLTSINITNINLMKQLFKLGMGVCDLASNNYGLANCDSYIQGQTDVIMQLPSNFVVAAGNTTTALITVFAYPKNNPYFNYQASFGSWWQVLGGLVGVYIPDTNYYSGAYRNPLQIQTNVSMTNNNQGFSASGYGDAWTGYNQTLVTVEVLTGTQNSASFNYSLKIGGVEAARGTMKRCQLTNCGI